MQYLTSQTLLYKTKDFTMVNGLSCFNFPVINTQADVGSCINYLFILGDEHDMCKTGFFSVPFVASIGKNSRTDKGEWANMTHPLYLNNDTHFLSQIHRFLKHSPFCCPYDKVRHTVNFSFFSMFSLQAKKNHF